MDEESLGCEGSIVPKATYGSIFTGIPSKQFSQFFKRFFASSLVLVCLGKRSATREF